MLLLYQVLQLRASTVKLLAKDDNKIILNYNKSEEAAKRIQKELENENIKIDIIKADVSKKAEVLAMISYVIEIFFNLSIKAKKTCTNVGTKFNDS
jgi:short-subunit dehydrogenase